jgi:hypothetical protein
VQTALILATGVIYVADVVVDTAMASVTASSVTTVVAVTAVVDVFEVAAVAAAVVS